MWFKQHTAVPAGNSQAVAAANATAVDTCVAKAIASAAASASASNGERAPFVHVTLRAVAFWQPPINVRNRAPRSQRGVHTGSSWMGHGPCGVECAHLSWGGTWALWV